MDSARIPAIELTDADKEFFRKFGRQPNLSNAGLGHGFEIIEQEFNDIQYELRMIIESKTAQITALTFEKEKLEKEIAKMKTEHTPINEKIAVKPIKI
jgi:S-adenosylhomocysteine hydrolase